MSDNSVSRARNKGGRPKKEAAEKLKYKVAFMLPTGDYLALKAKAKTAKLSIAEVARRSVTGSRITPRFTPEQAGWMRNMVGMGNNLNQLTKLAHQRGYDGEVRTANMALVREIAKTIKHFNDDGEDK